LPIIRYRRADPGRGSPLPNTVYGTTIATRLMAVPPRRFCPVTTISWLPRESGCVKYRKTPIGPYVRHRFPIDNQGRIRFGAADEFHHIAMELRAVHLQEHFLALALADQRELEGVARSASFL